MAAIRLIASLVAGPLFALAIFFGMSLLVATGEVRLEDDADRGKIEFIRPDRKEAEARTKERLPQKTKAPPPPKAPPMKPSKPSAGKAIAVTAALPTGGGDLKLKGGLSKGTVRDRDATPVVRVNPIYPQNAAARGIEGYVTLSFTITPSGSVSDVAVINASPPGIFDRAALKALRRWRYNPKLVDGKPVARPNQKVTLKFALDR